MVSGATLTVGRAPRIAPGWGAVWNPTRNEGNTPSPRTSPSHDGVMRYEIVDWGGLSPQRIEIVAASDAAERFYGSVRRSPASTRPATRCAW